MSFPSFHPIICGILHSESCVLMPCSLCPVSSLTNRSEKRGKTFDGKVMIPAHILLTKLKKGVGYITKMHICNSAILMLPRFLMLPAVEVETLKKSIRSVLSFFFSEMSKTLLFKKKKNQEFDTVAI